MDLRSAVQGRLPAAGLFERLGGEKHTIRCRKLGDCAPPQARLGQCGAGQIGRQGAAQMRQNLKRARLAEVHLLECGEDSRPFRRDEKGGSFEITRRLRRPAITVPAGALRIERLQFVGQLYP